MLQELIHCERSDFSSHRSNRSEQLIYKPGHLETVSCIWLVKDSGSTMVLINPHQYNPIILSLPNICTYQQFKYNSFSPILSKCIPRCLFPLAMKSYWIRIKHCHYWKKPSRRLRWLKNILKILICCYHFKNRQHKIWAGQLGVFFWFNDLWKLQGEMTVKWIMKQTYLFSGVPC